MDFEEAKAILGGEFSLISEFINLIVQKLELDKDVKILDVGTGKGRMAITLALNGYSVLTGEPETDNSEYAKQDWLEDAKKVNIDHLLTFKAFNAESMPFEDESFDVIFIMGALHHIGDSLAAYKECIRIIKKDGIICIIEPNRRGLKMVRKQMPSHPDAIDPRNYTGDLPLEEIKGFMFNAFIINC